MEESIKELLPPIIPRDIIMLITCYVYNVVIDIQRIVKEEVILKLAFLKPFLSEFVTLDEDKVIKRCYDIVISHMVKTIDTKVSVASKTYKKPSRITPKPSLKTSSAPFEDLNNNYDTLQRMITDIHKSISNTIDSIGFVIRGKISMNELDESLNKYYNRQFLQDKILSRKVIFKQYFKIWIYDRKNNCKTKDCSQPRILGCLFCSSCLTEKKGSVLHHSPPLEFIPIDDPFNNPTINPSLDNNPHQSDNNKAFIYDGYLTKDNRLNKNPSGFNGDERISLLFIIHEEEKEEEGKERESIKCFIPFAIKFYKEEEKNFQLLSKRMLFRLRKAGLFTYDNSYIPLAFLHFITPTPPYIEIKDEEGERDNIKQLNGNYKISKQDGKIILEKKIDADGTEVDLNL